jgi:hypothetical protein
MLHGAFSLQGMPTWEACRPISNDKKKLKRMARRNGYCSPQEHGDKNSLGEGLKPPIFCSSLIPRGSQLMA